MLLSFLIIASGWWHIRAAYGSDSRQFYISKPLTMLLIIALAFGYQGYDHDGSHAWILLGLCLSLAADEFEALRLVDLQGMQQQEAAQVMGVSRQTLANILKKGRYKVVECLSLGKALMMHAAEPDHQASGEESQ